MLPIITIVGRENVGKSTLFNRLVGRRTAITHREPGITRDRNIKEVNLEGTNIKLVDTGGYYPDETQSLKSKIREQIDISLKSADLILFIVDAKDGIMALDNEFATSVRKLNKRVILVVNKIDIEARKSQALEFYKLGFSEVLPISAIHSVGIDALIDKIKEIISYPTIRPSDYPTITLPLIAIIGRPNVGKSTYINPRTNAYRYPWSAAANKD
ncbi:MAG: GTP-binding protein [Candidatus Stahlbacteria bacterium]|nr:GTP-binding protein [Candidatus Stahlbacteria bacterium]